MVISDFWLFLAVRKVNCDEIDGESKITCEQELSYSFAHNAWALAQIFCCLLEKQKDYPSCNKSGSYADFVDEKWESLGKAAEVLKCYTQIEETAIHRVSIKNSQSFFIITLLDFH